MSVNERGIIHNGQIVLAQPLRLPDGTAVLVQVEAAAAKTSTIGSATGEFETQPFFGLWADRDDMALAAEWTCQERVNRFSE